MRSNYLQEVQDLRDAAEPFIYDEIVTKTSGTEPLMIDGTNGFIV